MTALSDRILQDNAALLDRMLTHPFVRGIEDGTLSDAAWRRYLVYEGAFVRTAIAIFAHATAKAPDLAAQKRLIAVQGALAHDQMDYFDRTFATLGIAPDIPHPPTVTDFDRGMLDIAERGDFIDIVAAMFAAEWMYWTWCSRAARHAIADPQIRDWVDMHADDDFAAQARWLKDTIDRQATDADLPRLTAIFARVTELEFAFHHAPLDTTPDTADA